MNFKHWLLLSEQDQQLTPSPSLSIIGNNFMLIGVQHAEGNRGDYPPITLTPEKIQKAIAFSKTNVFFDGPQMEAPIRDFIQENKINNKAKSWEPNVPEMPHIQMPALLTSLFGGHSLTWIADIILPHPSYDKNKTVLDNLVNTSKSVSNSKAWTDPSWFPNGVTANEIMNLVNGIVKDQHAKETLNLVSAQKKRSHADPRKIYGLLKSIGTEANIKEMYEIGHSLTMEAEYDGIKGLENHQGRTFGQKHARAITDLRDQHLVDSFLKNGGLYFAGFSHIEPVRKILQSKKIIFSEYKIVKTL